MAAWSNQRFDGLMTIGLLKKVSLDRPTRNYSALGAVAADVRG
jgi:hypothetical protein